MLVDYVLPAGTLLAHLNQLAATLELSQDCDNVLRFSIPARSASRLVSEITDESFQDLPTDGDWNKHILASVRDLRNHLAKNVSDKLDSFVYTHHMNPDMASCCCVVDVMEMIDDFSTKFCLGKLADQELKFGVPIDHLCSLLSQLVHDPNFITCEMRDFYIVAKCKALRHKYTIDISGDRFLQVARLDRTTSTVLIATPDPDAIRFEARFAETFPLFENSVLKHTEPDTVLVLPLRTLEGIINRWTRQFVCIDRSKYIDTYPLDCVARAIRAFPNSSTQAGKFIHEVMRTKRRFKYCSARELGEKISKLVRDHCLSPEVQEVLTSQISATYAYLVVFKLISKQDSRALSKAGKWITLGHLKMFSQKKVLSKPDVEIHNTEQKELEYSFDV
jgi:hypothetical protein